MKTFAIISVTALISAAIGAAATYSHTRVKWHDLGQNSGEISGKAGIMRDLTPFAIKGAPPVPADYILDVKASRLSVVRDGESVRLYFQE